MEAVEVSGLYRDALGRQILITQGLAGYTLVAGKKILFRLYTQLAAFGSISVLAKISYRVAGLTITRNVLIPQSKLLIEQTGPFSSSIGIIFSEAAFPLSVMASVEFLVRHGDLSTIRFETGELRFREPGRLRLLIHNLRGTAPWGNEIVPQLSWLTQMHRALLRMSALLPVRDGVKMGLTHTDAGLLFRFGDTFEAWPAVCPAGGAPPCDPYEVVDYYRREAQSINATGTKERVDVSVVWRPNDQLQDEPPGGKAYLPNIAVGEGVAMVVSGEWRGKSYLAATMMQEVCHIFGAEAPESPYADPGDQWHSRDIPLDDPLAFDFLNLRPYRFSRGYLGDVMGTGAWQGADQSMLNDYDWEHMRRRLVAIAASESARESANTVTDSQFAREIEQIFPPEEAIVPRAIAQKEPMPAQRDRRQDSVEECGQQATRYHTPISREIADWLVAEGVAEVFYADNREGDDVVVPPTPRFSLEPRDIEERFGLRSD